MTFIVRSMPDRGRYLPIFVRKDLNNNRACQRRETETWRQRHGERERARQRVRVSERAKEEEERGSMEDGQLPSFMKRMAIDWKP
jgi:hypothetical protein